MIIVHSVGSSASAGVLPGPRPMPTTSTTAMTAAIARMDSTMAAILLALPAWGSAATAVP